MTRSLATAVLLLAGTSACVEFDSAEVELLVPDDLSLHWDASFNGEGDDRVALVPVDLMVYGRESGEPVVDVELLVTPSHEGVEVLPFDDVLPVDAEDCDAGPCLWDAWRDRYVEIVEPDWAEVLGPVESLRTDSNGIARAYMMVDAFPEVPVDGAFEPVRVDVSMGLVDSDFQLVPQ